MLERKVEVRTRPGFENVSINPLVSPDGYKYKSRDSLDLTTKRASEFDERLRAALVEYFDRLAVGVLPGDGRGPNSRGLGQ